MKPETDIRFVYFDLGNILLSFDIGVAHANLAKLFGVSETDAKAAVYDSGLEDRFEHGEFTPDEFAAQVCKAIGATGNPPPAGEVLDAISDMFTPIAPMTGIMDKVKKSGRGVGILSNTCDAHWDWVIRQNYDVMNADLDVTILSYEVGAMKPASRIYEESEKLAGVLPSQILFIDDKQENVDAAVARGWQARQCFGGEEAIRVLGNFGLWATDDQ
ncbi:HAD family hydrolase [Rubripirellula reticaptiva]|uniref:Alpha-D-glucose-1-phosphate phosphatase YihX n=1 Tax=Rubripirellula reticaptiva TaxID=2528013 RepID=A0A5C6F9I9_9BACT|nr:HAD family phosphatase [Rubripirellula reticaptiva]TWU57542.1 Alpha-D-glucose-1-phosphate phosphatase YihX [Rubripirellula reticaptiva]